MKIALVSDTHDRLPAALFAALRGVDEILHAGDVTTFDTLAELEAVAPVVAVRGNCDAMDLAARLPEERVVERGGVRILLLHGHRAGRLTPEALAARASGDPPDVLVFGHTHDAVSRVVGGVHVFNPGTAGGVGADASFGLLSIDADGGWSLEHVALERWHAGQ